MQVRARDKTGYSGFGRQPGNQPSLLSDMRNIREVLLPGESISHIPLF